MGVGKKVDQIDQKLTKLTKLNKNAYRVASSWTLDVDKTRIYITRVQYWNTNTQDGNNFVNKQTE